MNKQKKIFTTNDRLILASASPRRRDFLDELGLEFTVEISQVNEEVLTDEKPQSFVERVSHAKACAVGQIFENVWVLAADTAVVIDGEILGKPSGNTEAMAMLQKLSGREHQVWTGYCLYNGSKGVVVQQSVQTSVNFTQLGPNLCQAYVNSGEPFDKAGGYGIQSMAGFLVKSINGSYSNVVGLPVAEVVEELLKNNVITLV